jgi:very-short-patch-repair endonuclease
VLFRRQVPLLDRFIADFFPASARLPVEVDGGSHEESARRDARRDAALTRAGYRVLRLDAALVLRDLEAALALVRSAL